jgi:hypothetical protein
MPRKPTLVPALVVLCVLLPGLFAQDRLAEELSAQCARNGAAARSAWQHANRYLHAWLAQADERSGLIPSNLTRGKDLFEPHNAAADNWSFMVLVAALTDRALYEGRMHEMLAAETRLASRVDRLPDTYRFSTQGFAHDTAEGAKVDMKRVIFAASEYVKDGLMPIHELLGETAFTARMLGIQEDVWKHAAIDTPAGPIPADDAEVTGEQMQVVSRLFWITGEERWLEFGCRLGDFWLLGDRHPTRHGKVLRLRDHGCELISGLSELYFACAHARKDKAKLYREPLHALLDRILEVGVNEHGMMWNQIDPQSGTVLQKGWSDGFGYVGDAFWTVAAVDGTERHRELVLRQLANLDGHYRGYAWEGTSADGYADAIEGALNLFAREQDSTAARSAAAWLDSEILVMLDKQQDSGIVEGWHGDGNFARTALMYALWKQQGCRAEPWRQDLALGAVRDAAALTLRLAAEEPWQGRVVFDAIRHRTVMHLPADYPRINQFPEWFTVEAEGRYRVTRGNEAQEFDGRTLLSGLELKVEDVLELRIERLR